jgi:hypothetical protein
MKLNYTRGERVSKNTKKEKTSRRQKQKKNLYNIYAELKNKKIIIIIIQQRSFQQLVHQQL